MKLSEGSSAPEVDEDKDFRREVRKYASKKSKNELERLVADMTVSLMQQQNANKILLERLKETEASKEIK